MSAPLPGREPFEDRLDALMRMLLVLDEFGVITDPIVTAERAEDGNGTAVTVEFLLDYDRTRQVQVTQP